MLATMVEHVIGIDPDRDRITAAVVDTATSPESNRSPPRKYTSPGPTPADAETKPRSLASPVYAPLELSSGQHTRHRLSRYGDRQLNQALHTIAITRARDCPKTRSYMAKRISQGKTSYEKLDAASNGTSPATSIGSWKTPHQTPRTRSNPKPPLQKAQTPQARKAICNHHRSIDLVNTHNGGGPLVRAGLTPWKTDRLCLIYDLPACFRPGDTRRPGGGCDLIGALLLHTIMSVLSTASGPVTPASLSKEEEDIHVRKREPG